MGNENRKAGQALCNALNDRHDTIIQREQKKVDAHFSLCKELNALYAKKNHDYGDSFHVSFIKEGMAMPRIRLGDKLNRFETLSKNKDFCSQILDETLRDTLIDLANYALMTIIELERIKVSDGVLEYDIRIKNGNTPLHDLQDRFNNEAEGRFLIEERRRLEENNE